LRDAKTGVATIFQTPIKNSKPRRGRVDEQNRLWFAEYGGNAIGLFDPKTAAIKEYPLPTKYSFPYDVAPNKDAREVWTGSMLNDLVARLDTKTGQVTEYLMPRSTNIRAFVQIPSQYDRALGRQQPRRFHRQGRADRLGAVSAKDAMAGFTASRLTDLRRLASNPGGRKPELLPSFSGERYSSGPRTCEYAGNPLSGINKPARETIMRLKSFLASTGLVGALASLTLVPAQAQTTAALSGQVSSAEEGAMEGVLISAKKDGSTVTTTVVSNDKGQFSFPADRLEPGHYNITIRAAGYNLDGAKAIDIASGSPATADIKLVKTKNTVAQLSNAEWLASAPGDDRIKSFLPDCVGCHTLQRVFTAPHSADE
jgi:hypothetical protein